jgi:hypothetical protein
MQRNRRSLQSITSLRIWAACTVITISHALCGGLLAKGADVGTSSGGPFLGAAAESRYFLLATRILPGSLYRLLERYQPELEEGYRSLDSAKGKYPTEALEILNERGPAGIRKEIEEAQRALEKGRPLSEFVRKLGRVARLIADINNPLFLSSEDPDEPMYDFLFTRYVDQVVEKIPLTLDEGALSLLREGDLDRFLDEAGGRSVALYPLIGAQFYGGGKPANLARLNETSYAFGIASLCFTRAVSQTAAVWYHVWAEGGGAVGNGVLDRVLAKR